MIKHLIFYTSALFFLTIGNSTKPSLLSKIQYRQITGKSIKKIVYKDQDFSNQDFQYMDFRGCTFENVDFTNTNLHGALFDGAKFIRNVNLEGAILYYPLDDQGQPIMEKAFRVKNWDNHHDLVRQYSNLMNEAENYKNFDFIQEARTSFEKVNCLNNLFSVVHLDLSHKYYNEFNLKNINLQGANLQNTNWTFAHLNHANLQGANLKNIRWTFAHLNHANLQGANLQNTNLNFAHLNHANLQGANLEKVSLNGTDLDHTNLQGASLKNARLLNLNLNKTNLIDANVSEARIEVEYYTYFSNEIRDVYYPIPNYDKDENLTEIYNSCNNTIIKKQLRQIMNAKKIPINQDYYLICSDMIDCLCKCTIL